MRLRTTFLGIVFATCLLTAASASAAPVILSKLGTIGGTLAPICASDTDGLGYYTVPGYEADFKFRATDTYNVLTTYQASTNGANGNVFSKSGVTEVYGTPGNMMAPSGSVRISVFVGSFTIAPVEGTQVWMSWAGMPAGVMYAPPTFELRIKAQNNPFTYFAADTRSEFDRDFSTPRGVSGERWVLLLISDRRGGVNKNYYRIYHELMEAGGYVRGYTGGYLASGASVVNPSIYVSTYLLARAVGGGGSTLGATPNLSCATSGIYGGFESTSTVLADALIAKAPPALGVWTAAGAGFLGHSTYSITMPTIPDASAAASETTGLASDIGLGAWSSVFGTYWNKILAWVSGFADFFWFSPFYSGTPEDAGW